MRKKKADLDDVHVPQIVVSYLGRISAGIMAIGGLLVWRIVELSAAAEVATDAAVVALVSAFIGYGGGALSALGAILASTRGGKEATPVTVENKSSDPVPVDSTPTPVTESEFA